MRIAKNELLAGIPVLKIRDYFRLLYSGCAVGGYPSVNWNVDDSEDLRLCVDGVDWLFSHAQRASGKIKTQRV